MFHGGSGEGREAPEGLGWEGGREGAGARELLGRKKGQGSTGSVEM